MPAEVTSDIDAVKMHLFYLGQNYMPQLPKAVIVEETQLKEIGLDPLAFSSIFTATCFGLVQPI